MQMFVLFYEYNELKKHVFLHAKSKKTCPNLPISYITDKFSPKEAILNHVNLSESFTIM